MFEPGPLSQDSKRFYPHDFAERFFTLAYAAGQRDMRERAAAVCGALADNAENSEQYRMGANWSRERIRSLPIEGEKE